MNTERCSHCGYRIPTEATSCPGCARAHARPVPPALARRVHTPLLRVARWTRRSFVLTAWLAMAAGVTALVRFAAGRERLAEELSARSIERLGEVAHGLATAALVAALLSAAALATWAARARRNLPALRVERQAGTPWALSGWIAPGEEARQGRQAVDGLWRDRSPILAALPGSGWTRRPVSLVVLHWWAPWTGVPAVACLMAVVIGGPDRVGEELALVGLLGGALAVAALRALYDVVGVVTFAQAHRAEELVRARQAFAAAHHEDPASDGGGDARPGHDEPTADDGRWASRLLSEPLGG